MNAEGDDSNGKTTAPAADLPVFQITNTQSMSIALSDQGQVHAIPTLDGFGLFVTAIVLGAAALWIWRRQ